jgi:hypothetical protein
MRVELLPGMTNVVRFPVERRARPTLELLRGIAPDVREVLNLAEAFGMEMPLPDLRERVDAATAEHIANQVPAGGAEREAMLSELLEPVVAGAIASCREAYDAWAAAAAAEETLRRAQRAGYFRNESLAERAAALARRAAERLVIAHMGPRRPRAWHGRSGSPVAARPGGRAPCAERPRSSSASRLAQPDLRQCGADLGMANCRRPCHRSGCRDCGSSTRTGA